MKNTIKYILILCAAPVLLSSCLKEEFPYNGYVTNDQIAGSDAGLEAATKSMISWMGESMTIYDEHWDFGFPAVCMAMDALTCDVAVEDFGYDNGCLYWRACLDLEDTGSLPYFMWMYMYRMINLSNNVLLTMETSGDGSDIESLSAMARRAIGQSLAYRALSYFYLARVFEYKGSLSGSYSGLTVPYIDQYTTESEARYNERVPHDEMYENIILRDLNNALKYLDGYTRDKKSLIDQTVVYGFLARTYLQMEKWAEAAEAARKAIELSGARMLTEAEWTNPTTGFNSLSTASWLWGVEVTSDDRSVKTGICNWVSMLAPEATFGYSGADNGRSAKLIDVNLYNKIPDTDWRKQSWLDPDRSKYNYQTNQNAAWLESVPDYTGIKFRPANGNTQTSNIAAAADYPTMRVEEMYLIEAEAKAMLNASEGKELLEAFAKTRNPNYVCRASDSKGIQDEIFLQRQIEFWGEGLIVFDYKRLNKPQMRGYKGTNHFYESRYNQPDGTACWTTLPLPLREMNTNLALEKVQNPLPVDYRGQLWEDIN